MQCSTPAQHTCTLHLGHPCLHLRHHVLQVGQDNPLYRDGAEGRSTRVTRSSMDDVLWTAATSTAATAAASACSAVAAPGCVDGVDAPLQGQPTLAGPAGASESAPLGESAAAAVDATAPAAAGMDATGQASGSVMEGKVGGYEAPGTGKSSIRKGLAWSDGGTIASGACTDGAAMSGAVVRAVNALSEGGVLAWGSGAVGAEQAAEQSAVGMRTGQEGEEVQGSEELEGIEGVQGAGKGKMGKEEGQDANEAPDSQGTGRSNTASEGQGTNRSAGGSEGQGTSRSAGGSWSEAASQVEAMGRAAAALIEARQKQQQLQQHRYAKHQQQHGSSAAPGALPSTGASQASVPVAAPSALPGSGTKVAPVPRLELPLRSQAPGLASRLPGGKWAHRAASAGGAPPSTITTCAPGPADAAAESSLQALARRATAGDAPLIAALSSLSKKRDAPSTIKLTPGSSGQGGAGPDDGMGSPGGFVARTIAELTARVAVAPEASAAVGAATPLAAQDVALAVPGPRAVAGATLQSQGEVGSRGGGGQSDGAATRSGSFTRLPRPPGGLTTAAASTAASFAASVTAGPASSSIPGPPPARGGSKKRLQLDHLLTGAPGGGSGGSGAPAPLLPRSDGAARTAADGLRVSGSGGSLNWQQSLRRSVDGGNSFKGIAAGGGVAGVGSVGLRSSADGAPSRLSRAVSTGVHTSADSSFVAGGAAAGGRRWGPGGGSYTSADGAPGNCVQATAGFMRSSVSGSFAGTGSQPEGGRATSQLEGGGPEEPGLPTGVVVRRRGLGHSIKSKISSLLKASSNAGAGPGAKDVKGHTKR